LLARTLLLSPVANLPSFNFLAVLHLIRVLK
jgi:hypothetical protein